MEPLTERLAEQQPIRQEGEGCRDASGSGRAAETLREHAEAHSSAVRDASNKMDAFAGRWVLHESTGLDAFLHVMGMGIVGRSLAATLPLANEIRVEQHADTAVMHVELQAPGRRMHYEHRMDGGSYTYRRPDNGCLETATTAWEGDRLVTLTQPSTPQVLPMRSERWLDARDNMVISHRICPTAPALLLAAVPAPNQACVSMQRVYRRCVQPPSALPSLPLPLAAALAVPTASAEPAEHSPS